MYGSPISKSYDTPNEYCDKSANSTHHAVHGLTQPDGIIESLTVTTNTLLSKDSMDLVNQDPHNYVVRCSHINVNSNNVDMDKSMFDTTQLEMDGPPNPPLGQNATPNTTDDLVPQNDLNIILWNIRGIHDKLNETDIQELLFKNDIVLITETHAHKDTDYDIPSHEYKNFPRNYIHPNAPGPSGGIGLFISKSIIAGLETYSHDESAVWLKLSANFFGWKDDKYLLVVYFPPADSTYVQNTTANTDYFTILNTELGKHINENDIFICGDFNARTASLPDYNVNQNIPGSDGDLDNFISDIPNFESYVNVMTKRSSKDKNINDYGRQLLDFCKCSGFRIVNGRVHNDRNVGDFTCITSNGASLVDYVLCKPSSVNTLTSFEIKPKLVESDHKPIKFSFTYSKTDSSQKQITDTYKEPSNTLNVYKWDSNKLIEYVTHLYSPECLELKQNLIDDAEDPYIDSNTLADKFYTYLHAAIDKTFQPKKNKPPVSKFPNNPWFNDECKTAKRKANEYSKKHDISKEPQKSEYHLLEKEYNRVTQKYKRLHKQNIRDNLEHANSNNPTDYWKMWKRLNKTTKSSNSKLDINDFETYFENQVTPPQNDIFDHTKMTEIELFMDKYFKGQVSINEVCSDEDDISHDICNTTIQTDEIRTHLKKLKNNKAAGVDGISAEFLKNVPDDLTGPLHTLFNFVFDKGDYPDLWAEGIINPVHKKGSENEPDNFRKITVMSAIGKLFESILNTRLVQRNITLKIDDEHQFGFKNDRRTTDNIFILNAIIERQKYKRKPLYVCFVDFTKAFDYVNRAALYYKLARRGVKGKMLNIICSMYTKAKCRVKWSNNLGEKYIDSSYGVLQGGMLSPHLFTEFLTDLKDYFDSNCGAILCDKIIQYILFADDLILCADTPDGLQSLLCSLYDFCKDWHLIVSLAKTNVLIFNKPHNIPTPSFNFGSSTIDIISDYKYLGTLVTSEHRNIFHKNFENLELKANKAIFALNMYISNSVGYIQPTLSFKMFDCQIVPILDYASDVWYNPSKIKELEKIHLKYIKKTLKVKPSSVTSAIYAETGRFPLEIKQKVQILKYWKRIVNFPDTHILKQAYLSLHETNSIGQKNWCTHVRNILSEAGKSEIWNRQNMITEEIFEIQKILYKKFMECTLSRINDSTLQPKLRTFKLFKEEFKLENYLTDIKDIRYQISLARFRISSHNLRIETGRYDKPITPPNERKCIYCTENKVEDECHFLLVCPLYQPGRESFMEICSECIPDFNLLNIEEQFTKIMSSKSVILINSLSEFVYHSFKKRNSHALLN